jgi:hypothetical protein
MRGPESVFPRHVRACQHSADHRERWFVWTWKRDGAGAGSNQHRVPYNCNSWRCEACRRHEAAVTFARIRDAVSRKDPETGELELDPSGWCFLVLTLDRDGYFSGKPWLDVNAAYASLGKMSRKALERIGREWGPDLREEVRTCKKTGKTTVRYVRIVGNRWFSVVEAHRSGWPHLNLVVWCPELAALLRREHADRLEDPEIADAVELARDAWKRREAVPSAIRELARKATVAGGCVLDVLQDAGWGRQSTAEAARDIESVIGYGVKLAGLHDASVGELAKVTQCPMNAPERFRRLRSGKGFLPPRQKDESVTGCLMRRRRSAEGDWELQAINAASVESIEKRLVKAGAVDNVRELAEEQAARQRAAIESARNAELQLIDEEEQLLSRNRGRLPAMPPLRLAVAGKLEGHKATSERRAAMLMRNLAAAG